MKKIFRKRFSFGFTNCFTTFCCCSCSRCGLHCFSRNKNRDTCFHHARISWRSHGSRIACSRFRIQFRKLGGIFFLPLILSPFIAAVGSMLLYYVFTSARKKTGITKGSCACVVQLKKEYAFENRTLTALNSIAIKTGTVIQCIEQYNGTIVGISAQKVLDTFHFISAGAVSFARGLNDTPKMVGLMLIISALDSHIGASAVAVAIATGGLLNAKKVGETMSKKITAMNHGQGFTANLVTAILVSTASFNGLPVSTTHVSVGSLFGIGTITKKANIKVISSILLSWVLTLPIAAITNTIFFLLLTNINF